jgi:hypothetical protein
MSRLCVIYTWKSKCVYNFEAVPLIFSTNGLRLCQRTGNRRISTYVGGPKPENPKGSCFVNFACSAFWCAITSKVKNYKMRILNSNAATTKKKPHTKSMLNSDSCLHSCTACLVRTVPGALNISASAISNSSNSRPCYPVNIWLTYWHGYFLSSIKIGIPNIFF